MREERNKKKVKRWKHGSAFPLQHTRMKAKETKRIITIGEIYIYRYFLLLLLLCASYFPGLIPKHGDGQVF